MAGRGDDFLGSFSHLGEWGGEGDFQEGRIYFYTGIQ